jgi:hypothetical protein
MTNTNTNTYINKLMIEKNQLHIEKKDCLAQIQKINSKLEEIDDTLTKSCQHTSFEIEKYNDGHSTHTYYCCNTCKLYITRTNR